MGEDDFIAAISPFAGAYAPVNYAACLGYRVQLQQYQALYALIGSMYGPTDNATFFTLPNLGNGVPVGAGATTGTFRMQGATAPLTTQGWTAGNPAAAASGAATTVLQNATPNGVAVQWCICMNGYWPSRP